MEISRPSKLLTKVDTTKNSDEGDGSSRDCMNQVRKFPIRNKISLTRHLEKSSNGPGKPHKVAMNIVFNPFLSLLKIILFSLFTFYCFQLSQIISHGKFNLVFIINLEHHYSFFCSHFIFYFESKWPVQILSVNYCFCMVLVGYVG